MVVAFMPSTYRDLVVFSLLLTLIILRPHGILGQPRVQKI
jgi:branched-chain amino acid transport system permease protein